MDDLKPLKREDNLSEHSYGNFTLWEFAEFYVKSAVDLINSSMSSNGEYPSFCEYSHQISKRLTDRFGLDERSRRFMRFMVSYGNANGQGIGAYEQAPITFFGTPYDPYRVKLAGGINPDNLGNIVQNTLDEIGADIDEELNDIFFGFTLAPQMSYPRIDSFDEWFARVRKNTQTGGNNKHYNGDRITDYCSLGIEDCVPMQELCCE